MDLTILLPESVTPMMALGLAGLSMFASFLTAAFGLGGGILMLSVLSLIFPPATLLPVHGAIQLGSNIGRSVIMRAYTQWRVVLWMSLGAVIGAAIGVRFSTAMPEHIIKIVIALFILTLIWLPRPDIRTRGPVMSVLGGAVISFTGMIVGVTGPLVMTFIRGIGDRRTLGATHSTLMTFQNTAKIVAFMLYGFAFGEFLPLILLTITFGFVGTVIGTRLLHKMPEVLFQRAFQIIVTVLALDMLRRAIWG